MRREVDGDGNFLEVPVDSFTHSSLAMSKYVIEIGHNFSGL